MAGRVLTLLEGKAITHLKKLQKTEAGSFLMGCKSSLRMCWRTASVMFSTVVSVRLNLPFCQHMGMLLVSHPALLLLGLCEVLLTP